MQINYLLLQKLHFTSKHTTYFIEGIMSLNLILPISKCFIESQCNKGKYNHSYFGEFHIHFHSIILL